MSGPRVLIAPNRYGDLPATEVAAVLARGWAGAAPHAELIQVPMNDGGPGFTEVVAAALGGTWMTAPHHDAAVPYLRLGDTAYIDAGEIEAIARRSDPSWTPETASDWCGWLIASLAAQTRHIVVAVGAGTGLDGGRGAYEQARGRLGRTQLTVLCPQDRPLLGFQGASAAAADERRITREEAQAHEDRLGRWVDRVRPEAPRDLRTGKGLRLDRVPGAGSGGGLPFGLALLGGHLVPGPAYVADLVDLDGQIAAADLVVTADRIFDWRLLEHSVLRTVTDRAGRHARPVIVLAQEVHVGRRELMSAGVSGAYAVVASGSMRRAPDGASDVPAELAALAQRVAHTWTPAR